MKLNLKAKCFTLISSPGTRILTHNIIILFTNIYKFNWIFTFKNREWQSS